MFILFEVWFLAPHAGSYAIKCNGFVWSCSWPVSWECLRDRRHDFTVFAWFTAMHVAREAVQMHAIAQLCCDRPRWSSEKVNNVVTCLSESELGLKLQFSGTFSVFQNRVENNVILSVGNISVPGVYETTECKRWFKNIIPQHVLCLCVLILLTLLPATYLRGQVSAASGWGGN